MGPTGKKIYFHVAPRYTPGSPAMVDLETADRVAKQELEAFRHAAEGIYGEHEQRKARGLGLCRIVEARNAIRIGWFVQDLITGHKFHRHRELKRGKGQHQQTFRIGDHVEWGHWERFTKVGRIVDLRGGQIVVQEDVRFTTHELDPDEKNLLIVVLR